MAFAKLFIPRKNYLEKIGRDIRKGKLDSAMLADYFATMARDEIANYNAIQNWANSLAAPSGGNHYATVVVAASNSINKPTADFVCTGTNDQTTINAACAAANSGSGVVGKVLLMEGNYHCTGPILGNSVWLQGMGGYSNGGVGTTINYTPGASETFIQNLFAISDLIVSSTSAAGFVTTLVQAAHVERIVTIGPHGAAGSIGVLCNGHCRNSFLATGTNYTAISVGNNAQVSIIDNAIGSDNGVLCGTGGANRIVGNLITSSIVGVNLTAGSNTLVQGNVTQVGVSAASINIKVAGTQHVITNNIVIPAFAGVSGTGISVIAGASIIRVILNDIHGTWATAAFSDAGTGTIKNFDGSANNWNLL